VGLWRSLIYLCILWFHPWYLSIMGSADQISAGQRVEENQQSSKEVHFHVNEYQDGQSPAFSTFWSNTRNMFFPPPAHFLYLWSKHRFSAEHLPFMGLFFMLLFNPPFIRRNIILWEEAAFLIGFLCELCRVKCVLSIVSLQLLAMFRGL
jgi:hypothetical protein